MNKDLLKIYMDIKHDENSSKFLRSAFFYTKDYIKILYDDDSVTNIDADKYLEWEKIYLRKNKIKKLKEKLPLC